MKPASRIPLLALVGLALCGASANAAVVFFDDFENGTNNATLDWTTGGYSQTANVTTYTVANTSGSVNSTLWVKASNGFNSSRSGLVDESENGGANFTDPNGTQAYGFRYTNTGLTSAFGKIGTLAVGQTITISFDVVMDGWDSNGATAGQDLAYEAALVLFNGASTRTSVVALADNTAAILRRVTGNALSNGSYQQVQFSYTVGDSVYDNNGAGAGVSTTWLNSLLGMDIALRFDGATSYANIDNVSISIVPEPRAALIGGLGLLMLLRRRR